MFEEIEISFECMNCVGTMNLRWLIHLVDELYTQEHCNENMLKPLQLFLNVNKIH